MAENKTQKTDQDVVEFLNTVEDEKRRNDSFIVLELMKRVTALEPKMWGTAIVGLGDWHYKGKSGREGDWFLAGFSPRKQALTIYLNGGLDKQADLLSRLGKFTTGKGCLYIKKIEDIDLDTLGEMVKRSVAQDGGTS